MKKSKSYNEAFMELQNLVRAMENTEISVDDLSVKIKEAISLLTICKEKLNSSEEEINQLMATLEENESSEN